MYSILLSSAVSFSLSVAKRDRHDMSDGELKNKQTNKLERLEVTTTKHDIVINFSIAA